MRISDRGCVRAAARSLSTLRNLALYLIRPAGLHMPEARENFREDRAEVIKAVTRPLSLQLCWSD
jgi:hypothetical protein